MGTESSHHVPVTYDHCTHVEGAFYHGTASMLEIGDQLVPGHRSNFQEGRVSNNVYFSTLLETAAWGAELATALTGSDVRGHIYVVEPLGPFEDDRERDGQAVPRQPHPVLPDPACVARRARGDRLGGPRTRSPRGDAGVLGPAPGARARRHRGAGASLDATQPFVNRL